MSYSSSSSSVLARKPKGLSKGAACVTCAFPSFPLSRPGPLPRILAHPPSGSLCRAGKLRKVRCDAVKPACSACRRSARWRGDDAVECCYVDVPPRRKSSKSHHDDLLRHCLRSASGDSTASSSSVSTPSSERFDSASFLLLFSFYDERVLKSMLLLADPFSSPPSPALLDLDSLLAFPIPSFPAITSSSTFALPELPPLDGTYTSSLGEPSMGKPSDVDTMASADMDLDSLLADLASSLPLPAWQSELDSSTLFDPLPRPCIDGAGDTAPQFASGLVASPSSYLDLDFALDLGPCPPLSPSFTASFDSFVVPPLPLDLPHAQELDYALAAADHPFPPSSAAPQPLVRRAARPERIAIPVSDPADPFAAAFGRALAERLCRGAEQLE